MSEKKNITLRTISFEQDNFLRVINPDQQIPDTQGFLAYNSGIYGKKNDNGFLELCVDLFTNSASAHQNLVNLKANLILGNNLQAEDDTLELVVDAFIAKRNKSGDNLKMVYDKARRDFALFNASVLQVVYNREGKIAEVYHVPTQDFRLGSANKYGQFEFGYLSKNWALIDNSTQSKTMGKDKVKIRLFDPTNWKRYPVQLMYVKDYSYSPYAIPSYSAAINWLLISREISDFHLNNIRSNFFLSGLLTQVKGGMTDEQLDENAESIEAFYKGKNGRKVLLAYVESMTNDKPDFAKFSGDDQDKMFDLLNQTAFQQIVTAHNSYAVLAGVDSKGSDLGGDANKLITTLASFNNLVCEPMKTTLLGGFNRICEINEIPPLTVFTEMPKITLPTQQSTDTTVNERRAILFGLPELDDSTNNADNSNKIPSM